MTRVDVAATRCAVLRVVSLSIVALFSLALGACGNHSIGSLFGGSTQSTDSPLAPALPPVSIVQIIGAPPDVTEKLQNAVTASAKDKDLTLVGDKDADYTVRGYLVAENIAKGTKLSCIWDVSDKNGKRARRIQNDEIVEGRKTGDPWGAIDDAALKKVAGKTTSELSDFLSKQAGAGAHTAARVANTSASVASTTKAVRPAGGGTQPGGIQPVSASASDAADATPVTAAMTPASTQVASTANASVTFVSPVFGAPGDGQTSLTTAMKRHLGERGVKLTENKGSAAYTVAGSVQMGDPEDGKQPITIRWVVKDQNGKPVTQAVVQRNKVDAGSLDGAWGQIADFAAAEAAKTVADLLPKTSG